MIRALRKMPAVWVSHGKTHFTDSVWLHKSLTPCSHIKGTASHKIVSDGELTPNIHFILLISNDPQRETFCVT